MTITDVAYARDWAVVKLAGELDAYTADAVQDALVDLIHHGFRELLVDAQELRFLSAAGITALVRVKKAATEHGGDLRLTRVQPVVQRVLTLARVAPVFL